MTARRQEQSVLLLSTVLTVALAVTGVLLGVLANSMAIVFDGLFSVIDVAMSLLALFVTRLVLREADRRFQYGYWHIEPMALAFNGGMLILLCLYAFVNAVGSLLDGGQQVVLGWALAYSVVTAAVASGMWAYEHRVNRKVRSDFVTLDIQSWLMTAISSAALVVAFGVAWVIRSTPAAHLSPYIDPAVLAMLSLGFVALPIKTLKQAVSEVLLMTPADLDESVRETMDGIVEKHGFLGYTSYAAKVGRGRFVEVHVLVDSTHAMSIGDMDTLREEIADALGVRWPTEWVTIDFTADEEWT